MIRNDEAKCGAPGKDKREIERVIDELGIEIDGLRNLLESLGNTLSPITHSAEPTGDCGEKEQVTTTTLGDTIFSYVRSLRISNDDLSSLLRRIEL